MYFCVTAIDLWPAISAKTRTPTPLLARDVIIVRLPEWLEAPLIPAFLYN